MRNFIVIMSNSRFTVKISNLQRHLSVNNYNFQC